MFIKFHKACKNYIWSISTVTSRLISIQNLVCGREWGREIGWGWGEAFLIFCWRSPVSVAVGHDPRDFRKLPYDFTNKESYLGIAWYFHIRMLVKCELQSSQIQWRIFKHISNLKNSCTYCPANFVLHFYFVFIYEKPSAAYQNLIFKAVLVQSNTTWHRGKNISLILYLLIKLCYKRWQFVGMFSLL